MDAGLAAVLGALAGAVATTGAAFATGWATREQARINARAEHKRQRREPRERIYKTFLTEVKSFGNLFQFLAAIDKLPESARSSFMNSEVAAQAEEIAARIEEYHLEVVLAGPESVQEPAAMISYASYGLAHTAFLLTHADLRLDGEERQMQWNLALGYKETIDLAFRDFAKQAQAALDDDGTARALSDAP